MPCRRARRPGARDRPRPPLRELRGAPRRERARRPGLVAGSGDRRPARRSREAWGGRPVMVYGFDDLMRPAGAARRAGAGGGRDGRRRLREGCGSPCARHCSGRSRRSSVPSACSSSASTRRIPRAACCGTWIATCSSPVRPGPARRRTGADAVRRRPGGRRSGSRLRACSDRGTSPTRSWSSSAALTGGPLLATVLRELGLPVALEASLPLAGTCAGGSLLQLCRAAADDGAVELLAHLRSDPSLPPAIADRVERRVRRGDARDGVGGDRGLGARAAPRAGARGGGRPRAPAGAGALGARAGRGRPPQARAPDEPRRPRTVPARRSSCAPGSPPLSCSTSSRRSAGFRCEQPDLPEAVEALASASVPHWRGPAAGRVRIMSPYRARSARARALFCASLQDGEFPTATPQDPLLSEERRREIGSPDLRRAEQADEERYLFHACVSRPTERLYLSWQSTDEDGARAGAVGVRRRGARPGRSWPRRGRRGLGSHPRARAGGPDARGGDERARAGARPGARRLALRPARGPADRRRGCAREPRARAVRRASGSRPAPGPAARRVRARRARLAHGVQRQLAGGLDRVPLSLVRLARAHPAAARARGRSALSARSFTARSSASTATRPAGTRSRAPATSRIGGGASSCSRRRRRSGRARRSTAPAARPRPRADPGRGVPRRGGRRRDRPAPGQGVARARLRGVR